MILCLIILIVGVISLAVGIFTKYKFQKAWHYTIWDYIVPICIMCGTILILISTVLLIVLPIEYNKELEIFISQKEYIENYEPTSEYDNAAITSKKVELNEWLYSAQHTREHYSICSFYSDEILEIKPIK